ALIEAWVDGPERQTAPDETMLIDFGGTGPLALYHLMQQPEYAYLNDSGRINYSAIDKVFVTHLHADHIGGLEEMGFIRAYSKVGECAPRTRPILIGSASMLTKLWKNCLMGGMEAKTGGRAVLDDYYELRILADAAPDATGRPWLEAFPMLDRYEIQPFATDHLTIERKYDWPSFGLSIKDIQTGQSACFSGDSKFEPQANGPLWQQARIIFHEVQLHDQSGPVHALLSELRTLPEDIRRKLYLYHYTDDWDSEDFADISRQFAGFAQPATRYALCP
ncbi:MAG: MBL fold metallo-hydrolase, partial [Phycisphaerales bacterium]|nr:MBL fold metallo-hydrolase [Phycisphaerales bacterium]